IDEVTRQVSRRAEPRIAGRVVRAEIGIPRKLLAAGLVLIDTPPFDGTHAASDVAADQADAVVFASAATAELSTVELVLVGELAEGLRTAMTMPATRTPDAETQLALAQRAMEELRRHTSRCQTVLGDQMADLVADVEHDLRDRTRRVLREVDRIFDDADPRVV